MEIKDELKEMIVNNAASWSKKEGDDIAEIYVDDFINELLSKFKLLTIPVVSNCTTCNDEINYKGVCEMCYFELKLNDLDQYCC